MRKTKIICTIGPACENEETLTQMCLAGMNVARLNFSHGSHQEHQEKIHLIRKVREKLNLPIAIMLDTKGPEYRIKTFQNKRVTLQDGDLFTFTTDDVVGDETRVSVTYQGLVKDLEVGDTIMVNNGLVIFRVEQLEGSNALCRVVAGGELSDRKSMNFPNRVLAQAFLSQQDREDLLFGIQNGVDFVAASFVSNRQDMEDLRTFLDENGGSDIDIIAKIENRSGVDHIEEICQIADGVMVARGDLGVEIPFVEVPAIQKYLINKCRLLGKRVITATEMLESMIHNPRPTRAEVSDVANAVFDGTSCVMLSGETAGGKYPLEALTAMVNIVEEAEQSIHYWRQFEKRRVIPASNINDAITHTCCLTAKDLEAKAILAATNSGRTARMICRFRPACPVAALTMHEKVRRQLAICWGVIPFLTGEVTSTDRIFSLSAEVALKERLVQNGDTVVITAGVPLGKSGSTNLIKAAIVNEELM